jgi:hypothetical protein
MTASLEETLPEMTSDAIVVEFHRPIRRGGESTVAV